MMSPIRRVAPSRSRRPPSSTAHEARETQIRASIIRSESSVARSRVQLLRVGVRFRTGQARE